MEKRTKQRIFGILIMMALVVILLPLLQRGKDQDPPSEAVLVKAPPFPDQSIQVTSSEQNTTQQPASTTPTALPPGEDNGMTTSANGSATVMPVTAPTDEKNAVDNAANNTAQNSINATNPTAENPMEATHPPSNDLAPVAMNDNANNPAANEKTISNTAANVKVDSSQPTTDEPAPTTEDDFNKTSNLPPQAEATKPTPEKKDAHLSAAKKPHRVAAKNFSLHEIQSFIAAKNLKGPIDDNGLFKLKNSVWVVQIGSFKNKANALRLVNQMRAKGYRAFIQQFANAEDQHTRVFVGPENKQASAKLLANHLETQMHIKGVIVSYKPLTL